MLENISPLAKAWLWLFACLPPFFAIAQDPVVLGNGNTSGIGITTSNNSGGSSGTQTMDGDDFLPNQVAASRFLAQATLGPDYEAIQAMTGKTFAEWLDEQLALPRGLSLDQYTRDVTSEAVDSTFIMGGDPNDIHPELWFWHSGWWQQ